MIGNTRSRTRHESAEALLTRSTKRPHRHCVVLEWAKISEYLFSRETKRAFEIVLLILILDIGMLSCKAYMPQASKSMYDFAKFWSAGLEPLPFTGCGKRHPG